MTVWQTGFAWEIGLAVENLEVFPLIKHTPNTFEEQPFQFHLQCITPKKKKHQTHRNPAGMERQEEAQQPLGLIRNHPPTPDTLSQWWWSCRTSAVSDPTTAVDVPMGAGDCSAGGPERSATSSPKISPQFSVINSTSVFTCTQQSLALSAGAGRQPLPLLTLASTQQAVAVGLLFQAATPPASAGERGQPGTSPQPSSDHHPAAAVPLQESVPSPSPPAWPPAAAAPRWVGSAGLAQRGWPG